MFIQIRDYGHGHKVYLISADDISGEKKANLDKIKLNTLIKFNFKFQCILFYTLFVIFFHLYKKLTGVQYRLIKA